MKFLYSHCVRFFATGADRALIQDSDQVDSLYRRYRWQVILWLVIGYGFFYTCRLSLSVAKKPMLDEGVLSVEQMGVIGAVMLYVYAFGKFFNGVLADYANIKRFMSVALFCSALVNLLFGATTNFYLFVLLWAVNGLFQSIGSAPSVVSICQWYSRRERGTRYGVWAGAHNIGEGLTFVVTAFVVNSFGWRWGFWGPGLACIVIAVIMFLKLADRPQTYGLPSVADYKNDPVAGHSAGDCVKSQQFSVLKNPLVWILGLSSACMYIARYGINSWAIFYLQEGKGYELIEAATTMSAYPLLGLVGAVSSGWISDRFFGARRNLPTLLYGLLLITSLCAFYYIPAGYLWLDAIALGMFGFAIGGLVVYLAGLIAVDIVPPGAVGATKGVIGLFSYIGAATQEWVSGMLIEQTKSGAPGDFSYSFDLVFYFWIGSSVLSLVLALVVWSARPHGAVQKCT